MRLFPIAALCLLLLASACSTSSGPVSSQRGASTDSLKTKIVRLQDEVRILRDSIQFYDDVDSGQYDREMRALRDQMSRMTYELDALRDGGQTVSKHAVDPLFEPASATLTDAGREALKPVAVQLRQTYPDRQVRVEGHSDNTPLGASLQERFASNLELSTARASAVVRALIEMSGLPDDQFVAVGYGASRPVAGNETRSGRRANRRVRVAVLPVPRDYTRPFEMSW